MSPTTNSDSEDDLDYIPPVDEYDSDSSGSDEQDDVGRAAEKAQPQTDPAGQKKQRDALWANFQVSVSTPSHVDGTTASSTSTTMKRVQIEKTYLFAGKHVTEVVEVAEDSEEAKKWPRWLPDKTEKEGEGKGEDEDGNMRDPKSPPSPTVDRNPTTPAPASTITATSTPLSSSTPTPTPASTPISTIKRPGSRKPRTTLPSIPQTPQAKKITTLDKCTMDWRAHVASQSIDIRDELDANRRGGGYLEKVDFLRRVEDRREDAFEASKTSKRRKI